MYFDWNKWDKALYVAEAAVRLDPNLVEAQKLIKYIEKQNHLAQQEAQEAQSSSRCKSQN